MLRPHLPRPGATCRSRRIHGALRDRGGGRPHDRRRAGNRLPRPALLYGRGLGRDLVPRLTVHRRGDPPPAAGRRGPDGRAGRIHDPRLPGRKDRPLAGRSRRRPDRLLVAGRPCAGHEPDARRILGGAGGAAGQTAAAHLAAGAGTGLLGGGCRVCRPHGAARNDGAHRRGDRPPAQLLRLGERDQGGRRGGDRRGSERREIDAAEQAAERRPRHGFGDRRNDAGRHRGAGQHRRRAVQVPRHGGHTRYG